MRRLGALVGLLACCWAGTAWGQDSFSQGALVIPMDTTYQDQGMFKAFGLLYQLLQADIPVHWVIKANKSLGDADLTTSSVDFSSGATVPQHGYRGGPFVVTANDAATASPIIMAWQATNTTTVHIAAQDFAARTGRLLLAAPTIAVIADGKENIAFSYLNTAGIPDRLGNTWSASSPDVLTIAEIQGPTDTDHSDGALFRPSGQPAFCQIMTMHWGVKDVVDEVVAEYRSFLQFPTHMMAECQAVNAIENNIYGHFITPNGFLIDNNIKDTGPFAFLNLDTPFVQLDGPYNLVSGSERAYSLPPGDAFFDQNVVMIKDQSTTLGQRSVWMTGYIDGRCSLTEAEVSGTCSAGVGKISYLGGHQYETKLPISTNPDSQGTRLFLNSLFEAACATVDGQPNLALKKGGPAWTTSSTVTYTLQYSNVSNAPALDVVLEDALPPGATFVSATQGGYLDGDTVVWQRGDLAPWSFDVVALTVELPGYGTYTNSFQASYTVGMNTKLKQSNPLVTSYQAIAPPDAQLDLDGGLPPLDAGPAPSDGSAADQPAVPADGAWDAGIDTMDGGDIVPPDQGPAGHEAANDGSSPVGDGPRDTAFGQESLAQRDGTAGQRDHSGSSPEAGTQPANGSADSGCDCTLSSTPGSSPWLVLLVAFLLRRRRRRA